MRIFSRKLTSETNVLLDKCSGQQYKVLVYEEEASRVAKLTLQYPNIETGGSIFGYWTHSGSPIISIASGPGRRSRHNCTSFYQDETYLHDLGIELYDHFGMQHIGEWHSHHQLGLNEPSQGDINTIISGMQQRGWTRFLLLITTIQDPKVGLVLENYFLFSGDEARPEPLRIILLPGSSPFRTSKETAREEPVQPVHYLEWIAGPFTPGARRAVHHKAAEEIFPDAWFTHEDARARLMKIVQDFNAYGIKCNLIPQNDGRELKLSLGDVTLLLGPDFLEKEPEWLGTERPTNLEPWSASTDLVKWYMCARQINEE